MTRTNSTSYHFHGTSHSRLITCPRHANNICINVSSHMTLYYIHIAISSWTHTYHIHITPMLRHITFISHIISRPYHADYTQITLHITSRLYHTAIALLHHVHHTISQHIAFISRHITFITFALISLPMIFTPRTLRPYISWDNSHIYRRNSARIHHISYPSMPISYIRHAKSHLYKEYITYNPFCHDG